MTKAELDDFKLGRRIPNCVIEARPLCDNFPQFLHEIILNGIKPPHHELVLSYMPSRRGKIYHKQHVYYLIVLEGKTTMYNICMLNI